MALKVKDSSTYDHDLNGYLTEVGDAEQGDFYPQMKVKKWNNEINFSMRLIGHGIGTHEITDGKVIWRSPTARCVFFDSGEGFEMNTVLKVKPATNKIQYSLQYKGLNFHKQLKLTQAEIDDGHERPIRAVNSFAVYHKTKQHNEYQTGKAFHIYRPRAIDANGDKAWGNQAIDRTNKILTKTIPQSFLDNAVYPVTIR